MATQAQIAAVQQLYIGYLGRAADKAGLDFWTNAVATGVSTLESVATGFTLSNEYKAAFGGLTNDALVEKVYTSVLGRASDTAGKAFWVDALAKGTVTADKLVATFIGALGAPDQTIINNKTFVAQTYTDTVGANYNGTAGAAVIANVDGTPASVATAVNAITTGTLTGLVPGVSLINAVAAANADKAAYGVATATTNPTFDGIADQNASGANVKDGVVSSAEATDALALANTNRGTASGSDTKTVTDNAASTATAAAAAKSLAIANGKSAAVSAYDSAVAAQKALIGTSTAAAALTAAQTAESAAYASADVALKASGATVTYATILAAYNTGLGANGVAKVTADIDTAAELAAIINTTPTTGKAAGGYTVEQNLTALLAAKAAVKTELAKLATYGQPAIDSSAKVTALTDAATTVSTTGGAGAGVQDYASKAVAAATAADTLAKVTVADAAVAAAKVVTDKYTALDNSIDVAKAALATFAANNSDKVTLTDISGVNTTTQATAKADVFYFGNTKAVAANDFAIDGTTNFGAGDSIVLGTGYTYNSGALSTGNANTLEFFLVKGATGTQVVIETEAYGNSSTTVGTDGTVLASPNATVINLVGVTADHLSVNNGVISYV